MITEWIREYGSLCPDVAHFGIYFCHYRIDYRGTDLDLVCGTGAFCAMLVAVFTRAGLFRPDSGLSRCLDHSLLYDNTAVCRQIHQFQNTEDEY